MSRLFNILWLAPGMVCTSLGLASAQDALVPGTNFNATAPIACTFSGDSSITQCDAGVIRHGGEATVVVTFPDGYERVLNFSADKFTAETAADQVETSLADEIYSVVVNGGAESFEIPDILIFGG